MDPARAYRSYRSGENQFLEQRHRIAADWIAAAAPGGRVLDVGCGNGLFGAEVQRVSGGTCVGMDMNGTFLIEASSTISVCVGDGSNGLPFRDASFDAVHMGAVIEHVFDYHTLFAEAVRILKPGGSLVISCPNMGFVRHRVEVLFGRMPFWYKGFQHIRMWTIEHLSHVLNRHRLIVRRRAGCFLRRRRLLDLIAQVRPGLASIILVEARKDVSAGRGAAGTP